MDDAPTPRTVALVGASGAGKTTLTEALLQRAGAIGRKGSVEQGTTVCDHDPESVARRMSTGIALAHLSWTDDDGARHDLTLADTPGHSDFVGAVDAALLVADLALVVVDAVDGVTAGTRAAWAATTGMPRMIVITQEDRARADFRTVLAQLRQAFGPGLWPLEVPLGEESGFHAIADVLSEQVHVYADDGSHRDEPIPSTAVDEEHRLHVEITEEVVAHDDAQLEAYLDGREPSPAQLRHTLADEVAAGRAVPVLVCSGVTDAGADRVLDLICELAPSARTRDAVILVGTEAVPVAVAGQPDGEPLVHVFRTVADAFVGQVSMLKVLSGTIRQGDRLRNASTGAEERLSSLFRLRGAEHLNAQALAAGDVGAVAKLGGTPSGTLLWTRAQGTAVPPAPPVRPPVYSMSISPVSQSDDAKLSTALARVCADDPTLVVERGGGHTLLRGLGEAHLAVTVDRLARIFGVHVSTAPAPVPYRETIAGTADVEGKLKKQSGGHGQFAVVQLRVSPLPLGAGFAFVDSVVGGAVPRGYIAAVEKGAHDALAAGGPQGHPVVDVQVELYDGKAHSVDSSEMAFRTAASLGVKAALAEAGTVVLEPVSAVTVIVPAELQGAVLTDISGRRGHVNATETTDDGRTRVVASVPEAELGRYALDLRALTSGQAELTMVADRYERMARPVKA